MALTRKMLRDLGVEKEIIDSIMDAHGETVETFKEDLKTLKHDNATLTQTIKDTPKPEVDGTDYKKMYNDEKVAHDLTIQNYQQEKTSSTVQNKILEELKTKGISEKTLNNPMILKGLKADIDINKAKFDKDGNISNLEELTTPLLDGLKDFVTTVETKGSIVTNPPIVTGNIPNPFKNGDHFSLASQTKLFRENPDLAKQMAAEVGIKID